MVAEGETFDVETFSYNLKQVIKGNSRSAWAGMEDTEIGIQISRCLINADELHMESHASMMLELADRRLVYDAGIEMARLGMSANGVDPINAALKILDGVDRNIESTEVEYYAIKEIAQMRADGTLPDMPKMVDGMLIAEGINLIAGDTSAGKTWMLLEAMLGVATGTKIWGKESLIEGTVLYYGKDTSFKMLAERLNQLCDGYEIPYPENYFVATGAGDDALDLSTAEGKHIIENKIIETGAVAFAIDDLSAYFPSKELNSSTEMSAAVLTLRSIVNRTGATCLVAHLLNKSNLGSKTQRIGGSIHIPGKSDVAIVVEWGGPGKDRTATVTKNRMLDRPMSYKFEIIPGQDAGVVLAFEFDEKTTEKKLTERIADEFLEILETDSERQWKRKEVEALHPDDLPSDRTLEEAWGIVQQNESIHVNKNTRPYTYTLALEPIQDDIPF
jgi:hypothetical protein